VSIDPRRSPFMRCVVSRARFSSPSVSVPKICGDPSAQANVRDNGARIHNLFTVQVYPCLTVLLYWAGFRSAPRTSSTFASAFPTDVSYSTKHSRAPFKAYIRRSFRLG